MSSYEKFQRYPPGAEFESPAFKGWLDKITERFNSQNYVIRSFTRDIAGASGDVTYTGYGFKPAMLIFFNADGAAQDSWGWSDGSNHMVLANIESVTTKSFSITTTVCILSVTGAGANQSAVVKTMNDDGYTLTWTKTGAAAGTATVTVLALKV